MTQRDQSADQFGFETRAIHAGQAPDPNNGAVTIPIYQTSTYAQAGLGQPREGYEYSRTDNPTRTALQSALASLEGANYALCFASGMAAETTLLYLFKPGDHIICSDDVYGGTYRLFVRIFADYGLKFDFVDMRDPANVQNAMRPETKAVWLETPSNPTMKMVDIAAVAAIAHAGGAKVIADNTFATPYGTQPLKFGADIVVHSMTKYLGGHSDVVAGAVALNDQADYERLKYLQNAMGAIPGPMDCWLTLRGIKTLAVRMRAHEANAMQIAAFLAEHPAVDKLYYPGHPSHPQHELAAKQMCCFGGMISFTVKVGPEAAQRIVERTKLFALAESLGGVESLIEMPGVMTHASVAGSTLEVPANLIRLSVGIESVNDLLADLQQAMSGVEG